MINQCIKYFIQLLKYLLMIQTLVRIQIYELKLATLIKD